MSVEHRFCFTLKVRLLVAKAINNGETLYLLGVLETNAFEIGNGVAHREASPLVRDRHEVPVHCLKKGSQKLLVVVENNVQDAKGGGE